MVENRFDGYRFALLWICVQVDHSSMMRGNFDWAVIRSATLLLSSINVRIHRVAKRNGWKPAENDDRSTGAVKMIDFAGLWINSKEFRAKTAVRHAITQRQHLSPYWFPLKFLVLTMISSRLWVYLSFAALWRVWIASLAGWRNVYVSWAQRSSRLTLMMFIRTMLTACWCGGGISALSWPLIAQPWLNGWCNCHFIRCVLILHNLCRVIRWIDCVCGASFPNIWQ